MNKGKNFTSMDIGSFENLLERDYKGIKGKFFVGSARTFAILASMSPFQPWALYTFQNSSNSFRCSGVA